jgi:hypothetical protein
MQTSWTLTNTLVLWLPHWPHRKRVNSRCTDSPVAWRHSLAGSGEHCYAMNTRRYGYSYATVSTISIVLLLSNGRHNVNIAPSIMLFVPNSLWVHHRSFSSEVTARWVLSFGYSSCSNYSPNITSASSLMGARPECFTAKVLGDPVVSQSSNIFSHFHSVSLGTPVLLRYRLLIWFMLFRFGGGSTSPQGPILDCPQPNSRSDHSLGDLQSCSFRDIHVKISRAFHLYVLQVWFLRYRGCPPPRSFTAFLPCSLLYLASVPYASVVFRAFPQSLP